MTRIDPSRFNPASMASKLQTLGFSAAGAQQLAAAQVLSDARDRQRLRLVLNGLFESSAVQVTTPATPAGAVVMRTQSGISIELDDDA